MIASATNNVIATPAASQQANRRRVAFYRHENDNYTPECTWEDVREGFPQLADLEADLISSKAPCHFADFFLAWAKVEEEIANLGLSPDAELIATRHLLRIFKLPAVRSEAMGGAA